MRNSWQGDNGYYRHGLPIRESHPLLPAKLPTDEAWFKWVQEETPEAHYRIDDMCHGQHAPFTISNWFLREPFRFAPCNVVYGGPGGVRIGVFVILRMLMQAVHMSTLETLPDNLLGEDGIVKYTKASIKTLSSHITASQIVLERTRDERRQSMNKCLSFQPMNSPDDAREEPAIEPPFKSLADNSDNPVILLSPMHGPKSKFQKAKSASAGVSAVLPSRVRNVAHEALSSRTDRCVGLVFLCLIHANIS